MRTSSAKRWTEEEEKLLAKIYTHRGRVLVGNLVQKACDDGLFPGRSPPALIGRITELKLGRSFTLWTKDEDERFRCEVLRCGNLPYRAMGRKLHESGLFPGRTKSALANRALAVRNNKLRKRFKFDAPAKDLNAPEMTHTLDDDKRPLMIIMRVLDKIRHNDEAWKRDFPKALDAVEGVYVDIEAARKELEKMRVVYEAKKKQDEQNYDAELEGAAATLRSQQLVDRELKKVD